MDKLKVEELTDEDYDSARPVTYRICQPKTCGQCFFFEYDGLGCIVCLHPKHPCLLGDCGDRDEDNHVCNDFKRRPSATL